MSSIRGRTSEAAATPRPSTLARLAFRFSKCSEHSQTTVFARLDAGNLNLGVLFRASPSKVYMQRASTKVTRDESVGQLAAESPDPPLDRPNQPQNNAFSPFSMIGTLHLFHLALVASRISPDATVGPDPATVASPPIPPNFLRTIPFCSSTSKPTNRNNLALSKFHLPSPTSQH